MSIDLEKIDLIKERMDISYREAKEALEENEGDVIGALAYLEEKNQTSSILLHRGKEMAVRIGALLEKGNRTKLKLKKYDDTLLEVPANLGVLALLAAMVSKEFAIVGAIGTSAALAKDYVIEIERPGKEDINLH
ncbi:MAG: DUF4342 domain-containing protein [Clostridia bacterium]|nr:DUF4342 domain-containing protein [Clostridia bacterium]